MIILAIFLDILLRLFLPANTFFFEPELLLLSLFFYYKSHSKKKSKRVSIITGICYDLFYGKFLFLYVFLFLVFCDCFFTFRKKLSSFSCFLVCFIFEQLLFYFFLQVMGYENSFFILFKTLFAGLFFNGICYFLFQFVHNLLSPT